MPCTRTRIFRLLEERGASYLLSVKGNQPKLLSHVEALLAVPSLPQQEAQERQAAHGRISHWQLSIVRVPGRQPWPSVRSVMALKQRGKRRGKHTEQTRLGKLRGERIGRLEL